MERCVAESKPFVILCVDDDPLGLMSRRLMLAKQGYEVLPAVSAMAALRMLRRRQVDLLITDHFFPGMTGGELMAAVRLLKPQLPIILLTGAMEPPPGSEAADAILTKGLPPEEFLAVVAKLLGKE